ncbi:MAG: class I SAM-dependent methyltransferase [Actinomycetota bacterium]|nr:class I SAM-dependent methyltransferase [Actinomycetota bacterium]
MAIEVQPPPPRRALSKDELTAVRRSRRHPRPTQFDYLHVRHLVADLSDTMAGIVTPVRDVLDVWCGSRPYDDLFPGGARCVGLDVETNPYGVADVVSNELLPFEDQSFDLVTCIEAFQWVPEPERTAAEFRRVLRPGGTVLVTLPFAFQYHREIPEARYTEHELRALFAHGWDEVQVRENGGRIVAWTVLTNSMIAGVEERVVAHRILRPGRPLIALTYFSLNMLGRLLAQLEGRFARGTVTLPMNLMLTARRSHDG